MKKKAFLVISKKVLINLVILLAVLALIITVTGIPLDFDIFFSGVSKKYVTNIPFSQVLDSIKNNFNIFFTGSGFKIILQGEPIVEVLIRSIGRSFLVIFGGIILAVIFGLAGGILFSNKRRKGGTGKLLLSLIPLSFTEVFVIVIVQLAAAWLYKNKVPILGMGPIPSFGDEDLRMAFYPAISIAIIPAAYIARITAGVIEERFTKQYIMTARGKGCSTFTIIKTHMMKSILYEVLSTSPIVMAIMFSSLVIIEKVYSYRGIGFYLTVFYTSPLFADEAALGAFSVFVVVAAVIFFLIFTALNGIKQVIVPHTKER